MLQLRMSVDFLLRYMRCGLTGIALHVHSSMFCKVLTDEEPNSLDEITIVGLQAGKEVFDDHQCGKDFGPHNCS
jgi:hypothetical protein